jgi:uncharacterized protein (TIGR00297 family)
MKRALIHAGCIAFALLFRWLTPHEALLLAGAACVFNLIFMPVLLPDIYREGEKNVTSGIFLYPVAVLLLVAMFPLHVAGACWAIMALGDSAAALAGRGTPWPWYRDKTRRKTIVGSAAFLVAGFAGGAALWWWISFSTPPWTKLAIAVALAALVESLPLPVADDLLVPLLAAAILGRFTPAISISPYGAAFSAVFAMVAFGLRLVTISGAIAGFVLATLLYTFGGWQAGALLLAFFVIGSGATRFAYQKKQSLGLAERRKGARVAEQAVANAGVALFFAFMGQPVGVVASLAAAAADTAATEIGPLLGGRVYLLATGREARAGVSGGVSIAGTIAGIIAAALVTAIAIGTGGLRGGEFRVVLIGAASGSVIDSLLGGTFEKDGWLNNEGVNFLGTLAAGVIALGLFR